MNSLESDIPTSQSKKFHEYKWKFTQKKECALIKMTNGTWVMSHVCNSPKLFLIEGDQSNSICKSQIINYVQESSEHENDVFHEEKYDVWGYLTTCSHCEQGSSKEGMVLGTQKQET